MVANFSEKTTVVFPTDGIVWTDFQVTPELRFVRRSDKMILQQAWMATGTTDGRVVAQNLEWRDVPVAIEALSK